ncbi:MAG: hypothetical protein GC185_02590 [Alphaproteobacteria bacterium]|nr:hypothetical protein [Alphaproteobacteria bacterium]
MEGRPPLGVFAIEISPPAWIGEEPVRENKRSEIAWEAVGLYDVPLKVRRDGFIIFEFDKSGEFRGGEVPDLPLEDGRRLPKAFMEAEDRRLDLLYRRLGYMNAFLMNFYSGVNVVQHRGGLIQEPASPLNYLLASKIGEVWQCFTHIKRQYQDKADSKPSPIVISEEVMDYTVQAFNDCYAQFGDETVEVLSLLYLACYEYRMHQSASAHLISWAIVEKCINKIWLQLQSEVDLNSGGHTALDKNRRKLLSGRDYTISIIAQILSLTKKVDDDLLTRMDQARKVRNNFAHSLNPVSASDATNSIRLATDLISRLSGFKLVPQLSRSYWM